MDVMTGGCQCGRVRYKARLDNNDAYLCHCRMCQRASGSIAIAYVIMPKANMSWRHEADWYASSPIARRPFCSTCGTTLGFEYPDSENIDLTLASFDRPTGFVPKHHFGVEHMHRGWLNTEGLPEFRSDESPATVERWMRVVGKLPE